MRQAIKPPICVGYAANHRHRTRLPRDCAHRVITTLRLAVPFSAQV
jgi:hypothetical protein